MAYPTIHRLAENHRDHSDPAIRGLIPQILKAAPFFQEMGAGDDPRDWWRVASGPCPWRGISSHHIENSGWGVATVKDKRRPLGQAWRTDDERQHIDQVMIRQGCVARRHNSMFVTGDLDKASLHGTVAICIPIGDFDFSWSPQVYDFNQTVDGWLEDWEGDSVDGDASDEEIASYIAKMIDGLEFRTTDLRAALASNREIMIRPKNKRVLYLTYGDLKMVLDHLRSEYRK